MAGDGFQAHQRARRQTLWKLLGDMPPVIRPAAVSLGRQPREDYVLELLELNLNGREPVPALWAAPPDRRSPGPAVLYMHWHGGDYPVGKEELIGGNPRVQPWAADLARRGIAALAIDSWCFGERMPYPEDGRRGEEDTFREMLWRGQTLFGMMIFDQWQALTYLCSRPDVDPQRVGVMGISMGATQAWWLAALDERVRCCLDFCCLTDFETLIEHHGLSGHGVYYYVPALLKHFQTREINELIVPRPRLSLNGRHDPLTPPEGVERVRDHLLPLYRQWGDEADCRIELLDCGHEVLPDMRTTALDWLEHRLPATSRAV